MLTRPIAVEPLRDGNHPDDRPVLGPPVELLERPAASGDLRARGSRSAPRRAQGPSRGSPGRTSTAGISRSPPGPAHHERAAERQHRRRQVRGRVAVRDRAADRAPVADLRVAHLAGDVREHRRIGADERVASRGRGAASAPRSRRGRRRRARRRARSPGRCRRAPRAWRGGASSAAAASDRRRAASRRRRARSAARAPRRP